MSRKFTALAVFIAFAAVRAASADPFLPVPPASFINYHVDTVRQLSHQVAFDPIVRERLARHFHMAGPDMSAYIQNNLVLSHLQKSAVYQVACVTPSGHEYYISQRLPQGTAVFALATTGQPILKRVCGNPLVSSLPAVTPSKMAKKGGSRAGGNRGDQPALADSNSTTDAPNDLVATSDLKGTTLLTDATPLTDIGTPGLGAFSLVSPFIGALPGAGTNFFIPAIAAIGTAVLFGSHHGSGNGTPTAPGGGGTGGGGGGTGGGGGPVPAPEPSSILVYAIGVMGLAVLGVRRRRLVAVSPK